MLHFSASVFLLGAAAQHCPAVHPQTPVLHHEHLKCLFQLSEENIKFTVEWYEQVKHQACWKEWLSVINAKSPEAWTSSWKQRQRDRTDHQGPILSLARIHLLMYSDSAGSESRYFKHWVQHILLKKCCACSVCAIHIYYYTFTIKDDLFCKELWHLCLSSMLCFRYMVQWLVTVTVQSGWYCFKVCSFKEQMRLQQNGLALQLNARYSP